MANNSSDGPSDDFFEQILGMPSFAASGTTGGGFSGSGASAPMTLRLGSGGGAAHLPSLGGGGGGFNGSLFPLGLNLEQGRGGFLEPEDASRSSDRFMDGGRAHSVRNVFHGQPMPATFAAAPHAPTMRPRVRARRGQATDPHSIAERLRRERIAERMRALQELVPSVNKSDRAAMLDEIVDYVKFLRLQVKVLSMSRLGGAGAVAPLVTDIPLSSIEEESSEPAWEKCSSDGTERQVAKLMEENIGSAMQLLQSKALCIMPVSLAAAIYHCPPPEPVSLAAAIYHSPPSDPSQGRN